MLQREIRECSALIYIFKAIGQNCKIWEERGKLETTQIRSLSNFNFLRLSKKKEPEKVTENDGRGRRKISRV